MSLPHALLGLINYQPSTGYDLKNKFQKSIHFFWNAALPHIYRSLKQMETQGWIASTIEQQSGKPNRKVYRIMDKGKKELLNILADKKDELNKFIDSNRLATKDLEDLVKIVTFYNSLQ